MIEQALEKVSWNLAFHCDWSVCHNCWFKETQENYPCKISFFLFTFKISYEHVLPDNTFDMYIIWCLYDMCISNYYDITHETWQRFAQIQRLSEIFSVISVWRREIVCLFLYCPMKIEMGIGQFPTKIIFHKAWLIKWGVLGIKKYFVVRGPDIKNKNK